ncbi:MAG: hypothetical protein PHQ28_11020 [Mycobacterium sp.]|nr:hypothetical protein [Mycobacterium sp.]
MHTLVAPPFANIEDAKDFHFLLMVFLRELKRPGEPVCLYQFLLAQALHRHQPAYRHIACRSCGPTYPCGTVLSVALLSKFPAPWTPWALAQAVNAAGLLGAEVIRGGDITWQGSDYTVDLSRRDDGSWLCDERQRGGHDNYAIGDDQECCDFIAKRVHDFPVGFGWKVTEADLDVVRPGVGPARAWWLKQSSYPYLVARLGDGAETSSNLQFGDAPDPFVRLATDDAAMAVQDAARVIAPGHELFGQPLQALARCERCYRMVVVSYLGRFGLVELDQTETESSPRNRRQ